MCTQLTYQMQSMCVSHFLIHLIVCLCKCNIRSCYCALAVNRLWNGYVFVRFSEVSEGSNYMSTSRPPNKNLLVNLCSSMCKECHILRNHELQSTMEKQNQPFVVCECGTIPLANLKSSSLVDPDEPGRAPSGDIHPPPFNSTHIYNVHVSTLS